MRRLACIYFGFFSFDSVDVFPGSVGYRNCFSSVYDADSRKRLENAILVPYIVWKTFWYVYSQDLDANEKDNSKEFFIAVKYEADLEIKG